MTAAPVPASSAPAPANAVPASSVPAPANPPAAPANPPAKLDPNKIRADFPLLAQEINGQGIVYLDSAATSQKPAAVIAAMSDYYDRYNANVHRSAYFIAEQATAQAELARQKICRFVGASGTQEIIFTKNATEAINLVANSWGRANLSPGDAVLLSIMEHHSNIVPWHILAAERNLELRWLPVGADYQLDLSQLDRLLDGVKLVAISAMSNVLGTVPPVAQIARAAHEQGAVVMCDACQFVPNHRCDVAELEADFLAFSGHKMCGPTGIGVLWGRQELLEEMPPFLGGGEMILDVSTEGFLANELPWKFEAGTPPIAEIIGLGAAVDYLCGVGMDAIAAHERELVAYAQGALADRFGDDVVIHGPAAACDPTGTSDSAGAADRGGAISFAYRDIHPHDVSQILDQYGVCVRAGHHCAKPLMKHLGVQATARASVYLYNTRSDIDCLVKALGEASGIFV